MYENNGVALACEYLRGDDLWKRIAAANLAGFWSEERRIETKQELFWGLRDLIFREGDNASASLNSIERLARHWSPRDLQQDRDPSGRPHPFLVDIPDGGNVLDTIVALVLMQTRSTLHFRVRAFQDCCLDPRARDHLYRKVHPHFAQPAVKENISRCLLQVVINQVPNTNRRVAANDESWAMVSDSNLGNLCIKLAGVLSPQSSSVRIVARIYSASALLLLLQHGGTTYARQAAALLKKWIQDRINLLDRHCYYWTDDLVAAEKVRALADLPVLDWPSVTVRDKEKAWHVLSRQEITDIVAAARRMP
ncbi:hypothetical protein KP509_16G013500 [Ceratopteris richardii]|uniref:Uncharacterized protein n=1 Tax=Ceratopteris richardii TaxID=49495 RepID=A0A8T2T145_CERRI|nr:hypothetical protein KP509_16G013500 [Ceratopteris richardii]